MDTIEILEVLQEKALRDENLRVKLIATREDEKPLTSFCKLCQEMGYPLYEMDLLTAGEEFHAAMKRSTNGGGENSPKLMGEDDFYELFFSAIMK